MNRCLFWWHKHRRSVIHMYWGMYCEILITWVLMLSFHCQHSILPWYQLHISYTLIYHYQSAHEHVLDKKIFVYIDCFFVPIQFCTKANVFLFSTSEVSLRFWKTIWSLPSKSYADHYSSKYATFDLHFYSFTCKWYPLWVWLWSLVWLFSLGFYN